jgi:CheY-like chemotaxis protein
VVSTKMGAVRVLVVEDQMDLADDIAEGLRDQGIGADVAYDGSAGIEKALVNRYDVIVLDRDLPKVHGDAVCAALVGGGSQARILMLTAAAAIDDRVEGLNLGADIDAEGAGRGYLSVGSGTCDRSAIPGSVRWPGRPAQGIVTVTDRPPSFRGRAVTVPPWIAAIEATMARPSPKPS